MAVRGVDDGAGLAVLRRAGHARPGRAHRAASLALAGDRRDAPRARPPASRLLRLPGRGRMPGPGDDLRGIVPRLGGRVPPRPRRRADPRRGVRRRARSTPARARARRWRCSPACSCCRGVSKRPVPSPPGRSPPTPPAIAALLAGYGQWLRHRNSRIAAALVAACWLAPLGWRTYDSLRGVIGGLDFIAAGPRPARPCRADQPGEGRAPAGQARGRQGQGSASLGLNGGEDSGSRCHARISLVRPRSPGPFRGPPRESDLTGRTFLE